MPTKDEIKRVQEKQFRVIGRASENMQSEFKKVLKNYYNGVIAAVESDTELLANQAADYLAVSDRLRNILVDAGFDSFLTDFENMYPGLTVNAQKYFEKFGHNRSLADINPQSLDALITIDKYALQDLSERRLVDPIRSVIIRTQIGSGTNSVAQSRKDLRTYIDGEGIRTASGREYTDNQINVLMGDSYMRYHREVTRLEANELGMISYIYYAGPRSEYKDKRGYLVPRPACRRMIDGEFSDGSGVWRRKSFTLTAVNKILPRKAQLKAPPIDAGGGYNCRHIPQPIDEATALEFGYTGPT